MGRGAWVRVLGPWCALLEIPSRIKQHCRVVPSFASVHTQSPPTQRPLFVPRQTTQTICVPFSHRTMFWCIQTEHLHPTYSTKVEQPNSKAYPTSSPFLGPISDLLNSLGIFMLKPTDIICIHIHSRPLASLPPILLWSSPSPTTPRRRRCSRRAVVVRPSMPRQTATLEAKASVFGGWVEAAKRRHVEETDGWKKHFRSTGAEAKARSCKKYARSLFLVGNWMTQCLII